MCSGVLPEFFNGHQLGLLRAEVSFLHLPQLDEVLCSRVKVFGNDFPMVLNHVDLGGLDLTGYDLSGRELIGCRFTGRYLLLFCSMVCSLF